MKNNKTANTLLKDLIEEGDLVKANPESNEDWIVESIYIDENNSSKAILKATDNSCSTLTEKVENLIKIKPIGRSSYFNNNLFLNKFYYEVRPGQKELNGPYKLTSVESNVLYFTDKEEYNLFKEYTRNRFSLQLIHSLNFNSKKELLNLIAPNFANKKSK